MRRRKRFIGGVLALVLLCESVLSNTTGSFAAEKESPGAEKIETSAVAGNENQTVEDLHIASEYRLQQDTVVNNLTMTAGSLDLNGYRLTVLGDVQHLYGAVRFHEGTLLCEGNYTMEDSGYLSMQNSEDTLFVHGDFTVQSEETSYEMSAGVIELKGDFIQKSGKREDNFVPRENHEVVFSGDKRQNIHFDSPKSYFNRVVLRNTSEEGIYSDGLIHSFEMERNGVEITSSVRGSYGWTLQKDEVYKGDLILLGDTLDLNGHALTVQGNLIQMNGAVRVSGGSLHVEQDYRIQSSANEKNEYSGASAWLYMMTSQDLVKVDGDFITESAIDHSELLKDGTLAVGGDVIQKRYFYNGNFATTSGFLLRMCGKRQQKLDMLSKLSGLEVTNPEGIVLVNEMEVTGNINDHGNPVLGEGVVQQSGTTFTGGSFQGTLIREKRYKMPELTYIGGDLDNRARLELKEDLTVGGNVINTNLIDLNGHRMEVRGNIENSSEIDPYGGKLICEGDFRLEKDAYLCMDYDEDYVLVKGDFYVNSRLKGSEMTGGILELQGDFIHTTLSTPGNFRAAGKHRTIFSGTSGQLVQFADKHSYLNEVELLNTSEEGVYAPNGISCKSLNTHGNRYETDLPGGNGWTLQEDEVYEGDLNLVSGRLDLNGHTLTVKGNLIQAGGDVKVHQGKLVVEGDYRIQSVNGQGLYGESNGCLLMTDRNDRVVVKGSFIMGSIHPHRNRLTNGEMKVAGDVTGLDYKTYDNFVTSGSHILTLNGSGQQTVCLSVPSFSRMRLANLKIENKSAEGVLLESIVPVEGKIEMDGSVPRGTVQVKGTTVFEKGIYNGDILVDGSQGIANLDSLNGNLTIKGNVSLNRDLFVSGTVSVGDGTLDLNGHQLTVGNMFQIEGKKTSFSGKGVLELRGDFCQKGKEAVFEVDENCKVVFGGNGLQTVEMESATACLFNVEITNTSEEGVYAEKGIPCQHIETGGNVYRTGYEGESGWTLSQDECYEGDLILVSGTLDLQGHELTIKGNLIQKGGNIDIHGGTLRIEGNYVLGDVTGSGANVKIASATWGVLQMQETQDRVYVEGNFILASCVQNSRVLTNGEMHVAGDVTCLKTDLDNDTLTAKAFTLVMDGTDSQTIRVGNGTKGSGIANLVIDNAGESRVTFDYVYVPGSVLVKKGEVYGNLHAGSDTEFLNECYPGSVVFDAKTVYTRPLHVQGDMECQASFTMGADITVDGNFVCMAGADLDGHRLEVGRETVLCGGDMWIHKGELVCGGNLRQIYRPQEICGLRMTGDEDYVLVQGNMYVDSYKKSRLEKGTLELKGNFIQGQYGTPDAFFAENSFVVIASGDKKQTITLTAPQSAFGVFEVRNQSEEGVYFDNESVRVSCLKRNGCRVSCKGGVFGWTLTEDMVLEEDLYLVADELDLNGYRLQVNGNIYAGGGSIRIHGGQLEVSGDMRFQAYDGHGTYSDSRAGLIMSDKKDSIKVKGDFVYQSNQDTANCLTAGMLDIKGNFKQIEDVQGEGKFVASDTHRIVFSGEKRQEIHSGNRQALAFANVDFSQTGFGVFVFTDLSVTGSVADANQKAFFEKDVTMILSKGDQIEDGVFGGNIQWSDAVILKQNMDIRGSIRTSCDMDLNGYQLRTGAFEQENGNLSVNQGKLVTSGCLRLGEGSRLVMEHEKDRILAEGDFLEESARNHVLTAGELEIKGNVEVRGKGFAAEGTHRTICSGRKAQMGRIYVQNINVVPAGAGFAELVLTKDRNKYYAFSKPVNELCKKLTVQKEDIEAPSKVSGLIVGKTTSTSVQLSWEPSSDDKGVSRYEVYRDGSGVGTTKDTKYTDIGLKPGQTYSYTVYAVDEAENVSEASETLLVTVTEDTEPPTKPGSVAIVSRTGSAVVVGWEKSRDNAGVKGYRIYRDGELLVEVDSDTTQYKDVVRTPGREHTYQVCAFDDAGNCSERSAGVAAAPRMPEILRMMPEKGEELGGGSVVLTLHYKNVGNSTGNRVKFQYSSDTGKNWTDINEICVGQNTEDYTTLYSKYTWNYSRLKKGVYKVRAILYDADGNQDEVETEYILESEPPKVPQKIMAEDNNGSAIVSWNPSASVNCTGYEVYRAQESGTFRRIRVLEGRKNISFTDRDVTEGNTYLYYVKAKDRYQMVSEASKTVSVTVSKDCDVPAVLSIFSEREKLSGTAVLTARAVDNVEVKSVQFQYYTGEQWEEIGTEGAEDGVAWTTFDTTVLPDGEHKLRAYAEDRSGNRSLGYTQEFEVDNTGVQKVILYESRANSEMVYLSWNPVPDEDIDYYVVEQWKEEAFEEIGRVEGKLHAEIGNLDENTEYRFRIVGYDDAGNRGEESDEICICTKRDTTAPHVTECKPVYSYFRKVVPLEICAEDNNELGRMKVYYSEDKKEWKELGSFGTPAKSKQYTYRYDMDISGLDEGVFYVKILVYDRAGNSTKNTPIIRQFYKDMTNPEKPSGLHATAKNGFIEVAWDKPQEKDFESFDLFRKVGEQGTYECIDRKSRTLNYFDTKGDEGQEIFYKLRVNDQAGNTGEFSEEVSARVLPDSEAPKIYGILPEKKSVVGINPKFTTLVADNRALKKVNVSFRRQGTDELWTDFFEEDVSSESIYAEFDWNNEDLDEGTYEFRIIAEDAVGNRGTEYVVSYTYDKDVVPEEKDDKSGSETHNKDKLAAVLPEQFSVWQGSEELYDGTNSVSGKPIVSWNWDFGNGHTAEGARVVYAYPKEGKYKITLTVRDADGNENSVTSPVVVHPEDCGGIIANVRNDRGTILPQAQVYIQKKGEKSGQLYYCDSSGEFETALEDGEYEISAYLDGHLPASKNVTIQNGHMQKIDFILQKKDVVTGVLSHHKLTPREIIDKGVDLNDKDNWIYYEYEIYTYTRGEPTPVIYSVHVRSEQWSYVNGTAYTVIKTEDGEENILIEYEKKRYLKQMFEVKLRLRNHAAKKFVLTDGAATLILPSGLSLAGMLHGNKKVTVGVGDIPGQSEGGATWYIRGDQPGEYQITAEYQGRLQPFNTPVSVKIKDKNPVVVTKEDGASGTDDGFLDDDDEPKYYQILVTNTKGSPVENAVVELWYGDASSSGITDRDGLVALQVNEGDTRTFCLTISCRGYQTYEEKSYQINLGDYMDSVRIVPVSEKKDSAYEDENKEYEGDFALKYVTVNGVDVSKERKDDLEPLVTINAYEDNKNNVKVTFSEKASNVSIVMKHGKNGTPVEIVSREKVSAKDTTLTFKSNRLSKGYDMYVRAEDEKTGAWHMYKLKNVLVVEEEPEKEPWRVDYNQDMAEQCALYSTLAYRWKEKDDGYTYDLEKNRLSVEKPVKGKFIELNEKMEKDGFTVIDKFMFQNYDDNKEDNSSFSIAHMDKNGKKYVYVVIRGTDGVEWYGNMKCNGMKYVDGMQDHNSFKSGMIVVKESLLQYLTEFKISEAQIVITGHSRGGAVANLLAKELIDNIPNITIGKTKRIEKVCAYAFATPNCTKDEKVRHSKYSSIFNFCLNDDFVPQVPLKDWGYDKYGVVFEDDSNVVAHMNSSYMELLEDIRRDERKISHNSQATAELKKHLSDNWKNVNEYYNIYYNIHSKMGKMTLFEYMHNVLAGALIENGYKKINAAKDLFFSMIDVKSYDSKEIAKALGISTSTNFGITDMLVLLSLIDIFDSSELYGKYRNVYGKISEYFFVGSNTLPLLCKEYIFSTHNPDNYYALLVNGGFDSNNEKKNSVKEYNSSLNSVRKNETSSDAAQFRKTLSQTVKVLTDEDEIQEKTVVELLGWNMDDTATWDGVTFQNGRITSVSLNQSEFRSLTLDLTGLDRLENLYCVFTGFKEIILEGCTSLKTVTVLHNRIETIDVSGCGKLTELDVRYNQLEKIILGEHKDIQRFDCNGNYLDIDSYAAFLRVLSQVKANGGTSNYEGQMCQKDAVYSETDIKVVQKFLGTEGNAERLGWEAEDISTWSGVEWKTVSGVNYIREISISGEELRGELDATPLKYLTVLWCSGNDLTAIDVSGCKKLVSLSCNSCRLTSLKLDGADELLYLTCIGNYLDVSEIEETCRKIQQKEGSSVSYEYQYILAGRDAFNEEECKELERFAGYGKNNDCLGWDMNQPGLSHSLTWVSVDGEYRLSEISLLGEDVGGELDLSRFTELKKISMIATDIEKVVLPDNLVSLDEKAFLNCGKLREILLPDKLEEIGEWAFKGCTSLKKMTFRGNAPKTLGEEAFDEVPSDMELHYDSSKSGWGDAYWKRFRLMPVTGQVPTPIPKPAVPSEPGGIKNPADAGTAGGISAGNGQTGIPATGGGKTVQNPVPSKSAKKYEAPKTKITKVRRKKRKITVVLKKNQKVSGYEVHFRKGKKGKYKVRKGKGWKKNRIVLKKLKRNSTYFIKARTYQVVGGKKYYSAFTKVKKVRVK